MKQEKTLKLQREVKVTWVDTTFDAGWHSAAMSLTPIITTGAVVANTREGLAVAGTYAVDFKGFLNPLTIPWGCIKKIKKL